MRNNDSSPGITNCIFWGNSASTGAQIENIGTGGAVVTYSDVQDWCSPGPDCTDTNIAADPLFVDGDDGDGTLDLSLQSGSGVASSLVLMSVVKDAERVGDYCKNLLEVAQMLQEPITELKHCHEVIEIGKHVTQIFKHSIRAFAEEDEDEM